MWKKKSHNLWASKEFRDKKCWAWTRLFGRGGKQGPRISDRTGAGSQDFQLPPQDVPLLSLPIKYNSHGFNTVYTTHSTSPEDSQASKNLMVNCKNACHSSVKFHYMTGNSDILGMFFCFTLCLGYWKSWSFIVKWLSVIKYSKSPQP